MDALIQDLRYALRQLRRHPGFGLAAVATLALGIGANTAIFSVVNGVLLGELPYGGADRLVRVWEHDVIEGGRHRNLSVAEFRRLRAETETLEGLAAIRWRNVILTGSDTPERIFGAAVTRGWFELLDVRMAHGRSFRPEEAAPGAPPVAILGHGLWQRRFGGDPRVVGSTVTLNGRPTTVVGVLPASFRPPASDPEIWLPSEYADIASDPPLMRRFHMLQVVVGRREAGADVEGVRADLERIAQRMERDHPETNRGHLVTVTSLRGAMVGEARPALLALMAAVGLVLLIACANLVNLLLARSVSRRREYAMRLALGSDRGRLLRRIVTESVALAVIGGAAGLLLAWWGTGAMVRVLPPGLAELPGVAEVDVDLTVLAFTLGVSCVAGVLFGVLPGLAASRSEPVRWLGGGSRATDGGAGVRRTRAALVVGQTALASLLLVGAGLMVRSVTGLVRVDPGFDAENLLTFRVALPSSSYGDAAGRMDFWSRSLERIRALPGVAGAAATSGLPLFGGATNRVSIEGRPDPEGPRPSVGYVAVTPKYFGTMGIPLLRGRPIGERDRAESTPVAVINETMAERFWPDGDPLEGRVRFAADGPWIRVVGVAADVRQDALWSDPSPGVYVANAQDPWSTLHFAVRTRGDPASVVPAVRRAVAEVDPEQPIYGVRPVAEIVDYYVAAPRFGATLLGGFASLALALAVVGVYGVVSYAVTRRRQELGIRLALGARPGGLVRWVTARGATLAVAGAVVGTAAAAASAGVLARWTYGITPRDPVILTAAPLLLVLVALLSAWLPARRAAALDPAETLRAE